MAELKRISPWDPNHLPAEISLIEAFGRQCPDLPQVACFDTAFHHDLPRVARMLPLPRRLEAEGVRRYGFHGLSFTYLMQELARIAGPDAAKGRVILAHLGAGASLAAVHEGRCIDTTMAFTPTAGLVMATRSGDIDPGLLVYLMRGKQMSADQLDDLVNRQSGLLGISETSPDMRDLLARQSSDDARGGSGGHLLLPGEKMDRSLRGGARRPRHARFLGRNRRECGRSSPADLRRPRLLRHPARCTAKRCQRGRDLDRGKPSDRSE